MCSCKDIDSNPDYIACQNKIEEIYIQCILGCSHDDYECLPECNRDYHENDKECPCQENCPNGCPCPKYPCQETTSTSPSASTTTSPVGQNKTVLVLNSVGPWQPALLINSAGRQDELKCFWAEDDAEASASCSLVWNNRLYIYGGMDNERQISRLDKYSLLVVGALPFDFYRGACTNMAGRKFFLCFNTKNKKGCYWSANPLGDFQTVTLASHDHSLTRISSSESKLCFAGNMRAFDQLPCSFEYYQLK